MTDARRRAAALLVALLILLIHGTMIAAAVHHLRHPPATQRGFSVESYRPIISTPRPASPRLFKGDRILTINDRPIRHQGDLADGLRALDLGHAVAILVEHYPRQSHPWQECVIVRPTPAEPNADVPTAEVQAVSWFGFVIWPAACSLIAALILVLNGAHRRTWIHGAALGGLSLLSFYLVSVDHWTPPLRLLFTGWPLVIGTAAAIAAWHLFLQWPTPLGSGRRNKFAGRCGTALISLAGALLFAGRIGALISYRLSEPFSTLVQGAENLLGVLVFLLMTAVAIRLGIGRLNLLTTPEPLAAHALKLGVQCAFGALGLHMIASIWLDSAVVTGTAYSLTLAWPAALGWVGLQRPSAPLGPLPEWPLVNSPDQRFTSLNQALTSAGVGRLLALYRRTGDELLIEAGDHGVLQWPPLPATGALPEPRLGLVWISIGTDGERQGCLVVAPLPDQLELSDDQLSLVHEAASRATLMARL